MKNFADRLIDAIQKKGNPSCVGLDPQIDDLPPSLARPIFLKKGITLKSAGQAVLKFNKGIIDATHDIIPAIKLQIAFYEKLGIPGLASYARTIEYAKLKGLIVIGDIKRSDIASTAQGYCDAHLSGYKIAGKTIPPPFGVDAVTLNPYMGFDSISPFLASCKQGSGIFVLLRTSNPSSNEIQGLKLENNSRVFEQVAKFIKSWGTSFKGRHGYSSVGAVVGATFPQDAEKLRSQMPHTIFLLPGYGAQGGGPKDIKSCFDKNGLGAIVVSARKIIYAYKSGKDPNGKNWKKDARAAALLMKEELKTWINSKKP